MTSHPSELQGHLVAHRHMDCRIVTGDFVTEVRHMSYGHPVLRLQLQGVCRHNARIGLRRTELLHTPDLVGIFPGDCEMQDLRIECRRSTTLLVMLKTEEMPASDDLGGRLRRQLRQRAPMVDPRLSALLKSIGAEAASEAPDQLFLDGMALALRAYVARHHCGGTWAEPKAMGGSQRGLGRAIEFMEAHLDRKLSLADVAEACGLSTGHFARRFKAAYGTTAFGYLSRARVEAATRLLARDDHSIAEIAALTGFSSQSHFTSTFVQMTGTTPARQRRQQQAHRGRPQRVSSP